MKIPKGFSRFKNLAGTYIKDPQKRSSMLTAVKDYAKSKKQLIGSFRDDLQTLIYLLRDWHRGAYTNIPAKTIVLVVAALLYFLSPLDSIPDFLGPMGFTDDATVILFVLSSIRNEINNYREWRSTK